MSKLEELMAELCLCGVTSNRFSDVAVIKKGKQLINIFLEGERGQKVVVSKMENLTRHGAIPDKTQRIRSEFDRQVEKLLNKGGDGNE